MTSRLTWRDNHVIDISLQVDTEAPATPVNVVLRNKDGIGLFVEGKLESCVLCGEIGDVTYLENSDMMRVSRPKDRMDNTGAERLKDDGEEGLSMVSENKGNSCLGNLGGEDVFSKKTSVFPLHCGLVGNIWLRARTWQMEMCVNGCICDISASESVTRSSETRLV